MIRLLNLTKRYHSVTAVNAISLELAPGELFGFLGPNGAGKTTTIHMIAGVLLPTAGTIHIDGLNIQTQGVEAKRICGFIPDRPYLYEKLTGREFLCFAGRLYDVPRDVLTARIRFLCDLFEISDYADELIESYSHGMKQRVVMAAALIHKPKVIIVDEPMVGLDPRGAKLIKKIFRQLCDRGTTVFMSTHTLEVAEQMCDRIGIIQKGELIAVGTMSELKQKSGGEARQLESVFFKLTGEEEAEVFPDISGY